MTLYERVKKIADDNHRSIASIEKEANIANGTIGRWTDSKPYAETLQKVAAVLGVSIEDLLEG